MLKLQCSWPGAFHNDLPFLLIDLLQSLAELENSICWKFFSFFLPFNVLNGKIQWISCQARFVNVKYFGL